MGNLVAAWGRELGFQCIMNVAKVNVTVSGQFKKVLFTFLVQIVKVTD